MNDITPPLTCSPAEQELLTRLAREAIQAAVEARATPEVSPDTLSPTLLVPAASFVTLRLLGKLRGCVGNLVAREPVYLSAMHNAAGAALRDTRFDPVTLDEVARVGIHISLLSPLIPVQFDSIDQLLDYLQPGRDGVVLKQGGQTATYLPQVWEQLATEEAFLDSLSRKAGLAPDAWRQPGAEVKVFRVFDFEDTVGR